MVGFFNIAVFFILYSLPFSATVEARPQSAEISGEIRDQRGDLVVGAEVSLTGAANSLRNVESDAHGRFRFDDLTPGDYMLKVTAQGFAVREEGVTLMSASASRRLTITLYPAIRETLDVSDERNAVSIDPDRAAGAHVLKEEQLCLTPDDPDQLLGFLQLLSTSSGSAPGQATVTVDGFTHEGRLPPKSAIREVRINSNIFSPRYDKPPYRGGRIDIYTKPGASAFHGSGFFHFNTAGLNARDVFAPERPPSRHAATGCNSAAPSSANARDFSSTSRRATSTKRLPSTPSRSITRSGPRRSRPTWRRRSCCRSVRRARIGRRREASRVCVTAQPGVFKWRRCSPTFTSSTGK